MRTFIAIELEPELRRPLVRLLRESLPPSRDVRWCTENQLHLTLKFLGEVRDAQLPAVCEAAAAAAATVAPFPISLRGLGGFPGPGSPRVLWCGVDDPTGGCQRWVSAADPRLAALGFEREQRAFQPHITLGRSRSPAGARVFRDVLQSVPPPQTGTMNVTQVIVFESRLLPHGAEYHALATIPLGTASR